MTGGGRHGGRRGAHVTPARTRHGGAPPSPWLARAQGGRRRPEAGGGGRGEGARPLAPRHDRVTSGAVPPMGFALGAVTRDPDSQWRGSGGGPAAAAEEERVAGGGGGQRQATPSRPRRARKTQWWRRRPRAEAAERAGGGTGLAAAAAAAAALAAITAAAAAAIL